MLALGTAIRWASLLPTSHRPDQLRPDISSFLGYTGRELVFPPTLGEGAHFTDRVSSSIYAAGLEPRTGFGTRFQYRPDGRKRAVLVTQSPVPLKHWHNHQWIAVAEYLQSVGYLVEHATMGTLLELEEQLSTAALVVGIDTGSVHLADYIGVPTLALYGFTSPKLHGVIGPQSANVYVRGGITRMDSSALIPIIADFARG